MTHFRANGMEPLFDKLERRMKPIGSQFFLVAAWYCLIGPFAAAAIIGYGLAIGIPDHPSGSPAEASFDVAACILLTSVLAGIVSLFGIKKHGWRVIAWKFAVGISLSCIVFLILIVIGTRMVAHQ